jgi:hypothetical protein
VEFSIFVSGLALSASCFPHQAFVIVTGHEGRQEASDS